MPSTGIIFAVLLIPRVIIDIASHKAHLFYQASLDDQPEGTPPHSSSPPDTEDIGPDSPTGQTFALEAFVEAVQALEQAKEVIAGRCERLLASPIHGLLDVVKTCRVRYHLEITNSACS